MVVEPLILLVVLINEFTAPIFIGVKQSSESLLQIVVSRVAISCLLRGRVIERLQVALIGNHSPALKELTPERFSTSIPQIYEIIEGVCILIRYFRNHPSSILEVFQHISESVTILCLSKKFYYILTI